MRIVLALAVALVSAVVTVTAAAVTGGSGPSSAGSGSSSAGSGLTVALDEWTLEPSTATIAPGRTRLVQENTGRQEHELLIVRTNTAADALPMGLEGVRPSLAGRVVYGSEHSHHRRARAGTAARHLAPGEARTASVRLRPGRYVLLCSIPGHYEAGQRATLEVG